MNETLKADELIDGYRLVTADYRVELMALEVNGKFPFPREKRGTVQGIISERIHGLTNRDYSVSIDEKRKNIIWAIRNKDKKEDSAS